MRLTSWNCYRSLTAKKAAALAALAPDVAVVQECKDGAWAWPEDAVPASSTHWQHGRYQAGIGVATFGPWTAEPAGEPRLPWVLDLQVDGPASFRLLATWTLVQEGAPGYPEQTARTVEAYEDELRSGNAILVGDFNASAQTARPAEHLANVARLAELGMVSALHHHLGIEPGAEPTGTLYWLWRETSSYHCDLAFIPEAWSGRLVRSEVGTFEDWVAAGLSDHVPVTVELDLPGRGS